MDVTVLGPQRRTTATRTAVAELIPTGSVATVNAGWRERESADTELGEVLGGRMVNLRLYQRWQELVNEDPDYAAAERGLTELLEEQQTVYAQRLFHAVAAIEEVNRRDKMSTVRAAAVADGIRALRALDTWHLAEVASSRHRFYAETSIGDRESVRRHRLELAELVHDSAGLVIAGGHVGVLLHLLHVFGLVTMIKEPVITWSAGAMALSDRVVLFGTHRPAGRRLPEVWAEGLGVFPGALVFPHPRHRLPMHDPYQLALLARRFKSWSCLLFDDGARVDLTGSWPPPVGARWLTRDGAVWARTEDHIVEERAGVPFDESGHPARRPIDADVVTARTA
ncbi:hypothetical protein GCM10022204_20060 [Microlunatus aurantiacus]|uniref:Uncharacterized protein n=1 Tax=Microlunatus aurantiacus TaxID=446786 RepID=A0ABP7DDJ4_9ACTN